MAFQIKGLRTQVDPNTARVLEFIIVGDDSGIAARGKGQRLKIEWEILFLNSIAQRHASHDRLNSKLPPPKRNSGNY